MSGGASALRRDTVPTPRVIQCRRVDIDIFAWAFDKEISVLMSARLREPTRAYGHVFGLQTCRK